MREVVVIRHVEENHKKENHLRLTFGCEGGDGGGDGGGRCIELTENPPPARILDAREVVVMANTLKKPKKLPRTCIWM